VGVRRLRPSIPTSEGDGVSAIELTLDDVERDREALYAWMRAHDLEPRDTAPGIIVREDQVTARVWRRDQDGRRYLVPDPRTGGMVACAAEVVRPLRQPLPAHLGTVIP
jgi:hypothetical protein